MNKMMIAAAAGLLALSALPASALTPQQHQSQPQPYQQHQNNNGNHNDDRGNDRNAGRGNDNRDNDNRGNDRNNGRGNDNRYGTWNSSWGSRPTATPPRHFTRTNDWYRHVRACQNRYRSYNPRTDTYVVRAGRTAICRL